MKTCGEKQSPMLLRWGLSAGRNPDAECSAGWSCFTLRSRWTVRAWGTRRHRGERPLKQVSCAAVVGPGREVMKDARVEVAPGLFFTTSPSSGLPSGAQRDDSTRSLLIHISHIPGWIERGGRWRREQRQGRRRERFDTGGWAWDVQKEWGWHAECRNT